MSFRWARMSRRWAAGPAPVSKPTRDVDLLAHQERGVWAAAGIARLRRVEMAADLVWRRSRGPNMIS